MPSKLLRPNVGIYVAHSSVFPSGINGSSTVTLAQLTTAATWSGSTLTAGVVNISPAVTDDYTLGLTDSQSDSSLSVVDNASVVTPTYANYTASIDGFRDVNLAASSVYNDFKKLFQKPDIKYYIIKRIGKAHDAAFAVGDIVSIFGVTTDYGVDLYGDNNMIRLGARFLTTGEVAVNITTAAGTAGSGPSLQTTVGTKAMSNGRLKVWWIPTANRTGTESTLFSAGPKIADFTKAGSIDLTSAIAWDSFNLGATDSNKIDDRGIVDTGAVQSRGFAQFDAALNFFRGKYATTTATATGTSAQTTITTGTDISSSLEIGMNVSGTGIGTGAVITAISGTTVTVSVANSGAVSGTITFSTPYSLAYDAFKSGPNNTRPEGYLVLRNNVSTSTALATNDEVNVFKFVADAVMDNTAGEDSIKFMVNFMPQGLVGTGLLVQA